MKIFKIYLLVFLLPVLFLGCGDKLDLSQFPITNNGTVIISDTSYVMQTPVWTGFNQPEDIHLGNEPLVYVADTKNNRIVQMDIAGGIIGILNVNNPRKVTQDLNFDLLIIGDSTIFTGDTISIVYRVKTVENGGSISNARLIPLIKSTYPTPNSSSLRKFTAITVFNDLSYLVTRTGPADPIGIDPGNAILKIKGRDSVTSVTLLNGFQQTGNSFYSIENVAGISNIRNSNTDFIITRISPDTLTLNKVLFFNYDQINGTYEPKYTSPSLGIISTKFGKPEDVCLDNNQNVYVIDSYRNFMFKFNSAGNYMKESFGGYGQGIGQFNGPKGISIYNKVIYISDTYNNRVVRYKLSTDLQ